MTSTEAPAISERSNCSGTIPSKKACRSADSSACPERPDDGVVFATACCACEVGTGAIAGVGACPRLLKGATANMERTTIRKRCMQCSSEQDAANCINHNERGCPRYATGVPGGG